MPAISAKRMQDRQTAILHAAEQVLVARGFASASISDIAAAAGVSDGLIYRYFANKRDLLNNVLGSFYERILTALEAAIGCHDGFAAKLEALVRAHLGVFVEDSGLCRLFISEIRTAADYPGSVPQTLNRRYTSVFVRLVEDAKAKGEVRSDIDARLLRDMLFGGVEHLVFRHLNKGSGVNVELCTREISALLLRGVAPGRKR
jgi:AcrR family transcriptional regulator